jgi:pyruvate/2-oxoglutarate dehydrogenase complex dihydrolipoamide acyltransferase (E2) component
MSIAIKTPPLPNAAAQARVGDWCKQEGDIIASHELFVEIWVGDERIAVYAPQAGRVKHRFFSSGDTVVTGDVLAQLETTGFPNLVWQDDGSLKLETYRVPEEVTTSMEYELRQLLRNGEGKIGKGFGSGLAPPQLSADKQAQEMGFEAGMGEINPFKPHPALMEASQFSGDEKDQQAISIPSNAQAQKVPQNAPTLSARLQPSPQAPTPRPSGG